MTSSVFLSPFGEQGRFGGSMSICTRFGVLMSWWTDTPVDGKENTLHFSFPPKPCIGGEKILLASYERADHPHYPPGLHNHMRTLVSLHAKDHWSLWSLMMRPVIKRRARRFVAKKRKVFVKTLYEGVLPIPQLAEICAEYLTQSTTASINEKKS